MAGKNMNEPYQSNRSKCPPNNRYSFDTQRVSVIANIPSTMIPVKTNSSYRLFSILTHFFPSLFLPCVCWCLRRKRHVFTLIHRKMDEENYEKCHQTHAHQSPIYLIRMPCMQIPLDGLRPFLPNL